MEREFTSRGGDRERTPTGYIYTADSSRREPQGLCSSILIIRYCSNTRIETPNHPRNDLTDFQPNPCNYNV